MSGSVRAARGETPSAPRQKRNLWTDENGVRTGWLLAASLFCYTLVVVATRYGLIRAFGALFAAWGVNQDNIRLAPAWARAIYVWHGSLGTLAFAAAALLLSGWLRGLWGLEGRMIDPPSGKLWRSALAAVAGVVVIMALCLLPDSARPEWPLTAPRLTWTLPALAAVGLIATVAEEAFSKRVLYDGLRGRWGGIWAAVLVCALSWVTGGGYAAGVVGAINALLLGWAVCLLYARYGFWTAVGFCWGWGVSIRFLLGFGGGDAAVYRLYGVSEALLTGGDAGPMHGLWGTLLLAAIVIWMSMNGRTRRG